MPQFKNLFGLPVDSFNILVTGADGYVGSQLIPKLVAKGNPILAIGGRHSFYPSDSNLLYISYSEMPFEVLNDHVQKFKPQLVIHLAGYSSPLDNLEESLRLIESNLVFLTKILNAVKNLGLSTFVNFGSCTEYNTDFNFDPAYFYSATKTAARQIIGYFSTAYNFKQINLIPYHIYGPNDSKKKVFDLIYSSFFSKMPIDLTPGYQVLDFIHISDFTDLLIRVVDKHHELPNNSNIFAGSGVGISLRELTKVFEKVLRRKSNINWGGLPYRLKDPMEQIADISKTKLLIDWSPRISIVEGVKEYIQIREVML